MTDPKTILEAPDAVARTAIAEPCGQCRWCLRRIAHLMNPAHYLAAARTYPAVATQHIDWTHYLSRRSA